MGKVQIRPQPVVIGAEKDLANATSIITGEILGLSKISDEGFELYNSKMLVQSLDWIKNSLVLMRKMNRRLC